MKKIVKIIIIFSIISISNIGLVSAAVTNNDIQITNIYIDNKEAKVLPDKSSGYSFKNAKCTNNVEGSWDTEDWSLRLTNVTTATSCQIYFSSNGKTYSNPVTGFFSNIYVHLLVIAVSLFFIIKYIKSKKFFEI